MNLSRFLLVIVSFSSTCECGNIFLMPLDNGYNSRFMNMIKLGKILSDAGHHVTILISDQIENDSLFKLSESDHMNNRMSLIHYKKPVIDTTQDLNSLNQEWVNSLMETDPVDTLRGYGPLFDDIITHHLEDKTVWEKMEATHFDLIIADEMVYFARIVAATFKIPLIIYSNWGPMTFDVDLVQRFNLAYVHTFLQPTTDSMSFSDRVSNVVEYFRLQSAMLEIYDSSIAICRKHGHPRKTCDNIKDAYKTVSLVFINRNDALHYPVPFMPHVVSIEGFFLDKPKPLNQHYMDIVERAGEDGIIVVSFGSMFRRLWPEISTTLARAFAAMPQIVIWSYEGPTPIGLGNNTIVSKWIPQEDLINHPATKLFVTQCGASSTFQALKYALPTIGVPLVWDQPYNCHKLTHRIKSAKSISLEGLTSEIFQRAMEDVIKDKTYKENANKAAAIFLDQLVPARDKITYWAEYVMRHKGAPHLRSQAANNLNFTQYYLLDIFSLVCFTSVIIGVVIITIANKVISFCKTSDKKNKYD
ncbi:unnamed protein product [Owenia fusiformis]|uniref:UDP-glucuronosyltransferase n=1 Tax=Owenia fusiformis TaxID=6347 RepID=A0A8J1TJ35_OWEFU|nr:unnamed protein product [Owenia fusiformis]